MGMGDGLLICPRNPPELWAWPAHTRGHYSNYRPSVVVGHIKRPSPISISFLLSIDSILSYCPQWPVENGKETVYQVPEKPETTDTESSINLKKSVSIALSSFLGIRHVSSTPETLWVHNPSQALFIKHVCVGTHLFKKCLSFFEQPIEGRGYNKCWAIVSFPKSGICLHWKCSNFVKSLNSCWD